jgi:hypothetical protein
MKRRTTLIILFILLTVSGLLLFRLFNNNETATSTEGDFREWFWQHRTLDLAVQVVLIFAGALGIAAILPIEEEDHD